MKRRYSYGRAGIGRVLVLALTCATLALARAETIGKVRIVTNVPGVDRHSIEQIVFGTIESVPGKEFDPAVLVEDIHRLYKTGCFEVGITYEKTDLPDGKAEITWYLTPKRRIRAIEFKGNKAIKTKRLRSDVGQAVGEPIDRMQLAKDRDKMVEQYRNAGYYGTTVTVETINAQHAHEVTVVFDIKEAPRAKLEKVEFTGNTVFTTSELRSRIPTRRPWWRYIFRWGNYYDKDLLQADKDILRQIYTDRGYLDFEVTKVDTRYGKKNKWVTVIFHLSEGSPYRVTKVSVEGNKRFSGAELLKVVGTKPQHIYSASQERADEQAIEAKYDRLGYIDIRCYPVHTVNDRNHTVSVQYRISEGQVVHIRNIYIVGNEITQDRVIRRELAIQPGDLGDYGKIRASKARLQNLNYFDKVEITPVATEEPDLRDLRIQLSEKRTGQFSVGAGFSSNDALVGFVEVEENNFDLMRLFDWPPKGAGQRLLLRAQVGTQLTDFTLSFTEPWWLQRKLRLDVELFSHTRVEDNYNRLTTGAGVMVTRPWGKYWRQSFGIRAERDTISHIDSDASAILKKERGSYWANRLIFRVERDTRDRYIFPTRGSKLSLQAEVITAALGSYSNYGRFDVSGTKYFPVLKDCTLKLGGEMAVASRFSGDDIRIFDRYFAGGEYSIRGFKRRDVSPVDQNDDSIGGKSLFLANVELLKPIRDFMYLSVFCDTGNVWWNSWAINPTDINAAVGIGVQFKILPIRIDYGYPIVTRTNRQRTSKGQFNFNIGYSF